MQLQCIRCQTFQLHTASLLVYTTLCLKPVSDLEFFTDDTVNICPHTDTLAACSLASTFWELLFLMSLSARVLSPCWNSSTVSWMTLMYYTPQL